MGGEWNKNFGKPDIQLTVGVSAVSILDEVWFITAFNGKMYNTLQ